MNRSKRLLVIPCLSFFAGMLPNIAAAQNNAATALSTSFREPNGSKAVSAAELITVAPEPFNRRFPRMRRGCRENCTWCWLVHKERSTPASVLTSPSN